MVLNFPADRTISGCIAAVFGFLFLVSPAVRAQTIYPVSDTLGLFTAPAPTEHFNAWFWGGTAVLTTAAFFADEPLRGAFRRTDLSGFEPFLAAGEVFGNGWYCVPAAALVTGAGFLVKSKTMAALGTHLLEAYAITGLSVTAVKYLAGRSRPYTGRDSLDFKPPGLTGSRRSFYSGHTTTAFAAAAVLSEFFDNPAVSIPVYILASLTGLQRITHDKHWLSDVVLGAATGWYVGRSIAAQNADYAKLQIDPNGVKISFKLKEF
jgi:membrane-associated phospholipid phosphatase